MTERDKLGDVDRLREPRAAKVQRVRILFVLYEGERNHARSAGVHDVNDVPGLLCPVQRIRPRSPTTLFSSLLAVDLGTGQRKRLDRDSWLKERDTFGGDLGVRRVKEEVRSASGGEEMGDRRRGIVNRYDYAVIVLLAVVPGKCKAQREGVTQSRQT